MEGPSLRRAEDRRQSQPLAAEDPVVEPMERAQNRAWHTLRALGVSSYHHYHY